MGNTAGKIDPKRRAKIYKRVSLADAQKQFTKLKELELKPETLELLRKPPVSANFYSYNYRLHTSEYELDGGWALNQGLLFFLKCNFTNTKVLNTPDNYSLGLEKDQYDALYPTSTTTLSSPV